jgi:hypothetical protein
VGEGRAGGVGAWLVMMGAGDSGGWRGGGGQVGYAGAAISIGREAEAGHTQARQPRRMSPPRPGRVCRGLPSIARRRSARRGGGVGGGPQSLSRTVAAASRVGPVSPGQITAGGRQGGTFRFPGGARWLCRLLSCLRPGPGVVEPERLWQTGDAMRDSEDWAQFGGRTCASEFVRWMLSRRTQRVLFPYDGWWRWVLLLRSSRDCLDARSLRRARPCFCHRLLTAFSRC